MNRNAIERALERYAGHKDPSVREALANRVAAASGRPRERTDQ